MVRTAARRRLKGDQVWHSGTMRSRLLGYHTFGSTFGSKRGIYGWEVRCSCGWSKKTNENDRRALQYWNDHVLGTGRAGFGFGPARVQ